MAKRRPAPEEEQPVDLNMTPMIDVVFQLLIFFMLTMHFKEVEGKLLSQLPKDKGLNPSPITSPELQEVRIVLCAGGDIRMHLRDKGRHEDPNNPKNNEVCSVQVEQQPIGEVYKTSVDKYKDKAGHNRRMYQELGKKAKELYQMTPSSRDPAKQSPLIIDADSEVPYEHIIGAVNACKEVGIDNVEFVGNPRHEKYYGTGETGRYRRR